MSRNARLRWIAMRIGAEQRNAAQTKGAMQKGRKQWEGRGGCQKQGLEISTLLFLFTFSLIVATRDFTETGLSAFFPPKMPR